MTADTDRSGARDPTAFQRLVGTVLAGRYQVTGVLGAGGMGVVLEARQIAMDRRVAVKLLHPSFGANRHAVARFIREMQVTSRLEHPATVRVYDFGEASDADGAHLFLVMELLQGETLGAVLATGPLEHRRMARIAAQIARALEAAHGEAIVHRDLKPDNVMLIDRYGAADQVKVLDFGIARFMDGAEGEGMGKLTAEGAVVGTPAYMSPEQATGAPIGSASDLYSLGVMLFEMATGVVPFSAPTTVSLMVKHVQEPPPRPSALVPMPAALEALILQCLAKDPAERPASAGVVADALDALADELGGGARGEPLRSAGPETADTARRGPFDVARARRGGWPFLIGGLIGLGAVVVLLLGRGPEVTAEATLVPANALEVSAPSDVASQDVASPAADVVTAPEGELAGAPPLPPGCRGEVVEAAREAFAARAPEARQKALLGVDACGDWAPAHLVLGQVQQADQAWEAARASYKNAIALAPRWGVPRFDAALVELAAGQPRQAQVELDALIALAPAWPNAHLLRAQAALGLKDFAGARADAEVATRLDPERAEAWFLLGETHRALGPAGSAAIADDAYCRAKALGFTAAAARCPR